MRAIDIHPSTLNKQSQEFKRLPVETRILLGSIVDLNGCYTWLGYKNRHGYGEIRSNNRVVFIHRAAWMAANGPIPADLVVDHMCHNRACTRLTHLRLLPAAENCRIQIHRPRIRPLRTHCMWGHLYTDETTYVHDGRRYCRPCNKRRSRNRPTRRGAEVSG